MTANVSFVSADMPVESRSAQQTSNLTVLSDRFKRTKSTSPWLSSSNSTRCSGPVIERHIASYLPRHTSISDCFDRRTIVFEVVWLADVAICPEFETPRDIIRSLGGGKYDDG